MNPTSLPLPFLLLAAGAVASILLGALPAARRRPAIAVAPTLAALWGAWLALTWGLGMEPAPGPLRLDDAAILIGLLATLGAFLSILLLLKTADEEGFPAGMAAGLAAMAAAGSLLAASATDPKTGAWGLAAAIISLGGALAIGRRRAAADPRAAAPASLAGLFASGTILAGAGYLIRLLSSLSAESATLLGDGLAAGAGAAMAGGSLAAAVARNPRRLLGWLCVAQAGFALLVLRGVAVPAGPEAAGMAFLHLIGCLACPIGAFGALEVLSEPGRPQTSFSDLAGLWRARPFPAAVLAMSALGMCGMLDNLHMRILPFGIATLFGPAGLTPVAMASEVLAAVAAGRIIYSLRGRSPATKPAPTRHAPAAVALAFCALLTAWLAARPETFLAIARRASDAFRP